MNKKFMGWWITIAAFMTFGFSTGLPYYNMPFFYDYYQKNFGWSRADITLGFPLAALFTLWVGPLLVHRFSPRMLVIAGTLLTFLSFIGFSQMTGDLNFYYAMWFVYIVGYVFSGPIPHQVIVTQWFRKKRGRAMGIVYVGVGAIGSMGSFLVKPIAEAYDFRTALLVVGALVVVLAWPVAFFILKDKPADVGQQPDGEAVAPADLKVAPKPFMYLLSRPAFWLLLIGSMCSIGSIGSINQHMKLVFQEQGFADQADLNSAWRTANVLILWSSIGGRLFMGWLADRYTKKYVMTATYAMVALTIPLMLLVRPGTSLELYAFAVLFGFGMGADYMLIPLMAADQFGVNTLARAMAIILPTDTIGQTWFPYIVSLLHRAWGGYEKALMAVFVMAFVGAIAIALLPKHGPKDDTTVPGAAGVPAK
ncbi:MAG: MFS transporter [Bryobacterales bacterium]|nr:MFS transporter [Bryobacterales bacterium]